MRAHTDAASGAPAFVEWVNARGPALQRFCYLTTGDAGLAGSVVEQALETVHQRWREVADVVDLEIFVRQEILRVQTTRRHRAARQAAARTEAAGGPEPPSGDEGIHRIWQTCQALPLEARAALALHYAEQLDVADIAEVLGRGLSAARDLVDSGVARVSSLSSSRADSRPDDSRPGDPPDNSRPGDRPAAEALLRDTFSAYGSRAPMAEDLAGRVVVVARRRRRRRGAIGTVAAVALLVPVAWLASPPEEPPPEPAPGVPLAALPEMRWESYGGIEVQVPDGWGYGDLTQWCAPDDAPGHVDGPAVDRPSAGWKAQTALCTANSATGTRGVQRPTYTAGLLLRPAEAGPRIGRADVASGAPIYRRRLGGVDLTVIDVERSLADRILGSATVVGGTDLNGCATHANPPAMGRFEPVNGGGVEAAAEDFVDTGHASMSICHYETKPWGRPTLVFSERSGRSEAVRMLAAIGAAQPTAARAPAGTGPGCAGVEVARVRFWSSGSPIDAWVHYAGCGPHGVDDGVRPRSLTRDLLRPVLDSPWRGTVGAGVPWPDDPVESTG